MTLRTIGTALIALAALSTPAFAQGIVFQDGFENGFAQWTATGLWNPVSSTNACVTSLAGFPDGVTAAWYGNPATCDYQTGAPTSGRLELNTWIQLPTNVASVSLYFGSRVHSEYCGNGYDRHEVHVMAQTGLNPGFTELLCSFTDEPLHTPVALPFHERRIDLSNYRGAQVRVAFEFRSIDAFFNNTLGWLVDDVRIVAEPGSTYCPSAHAPSGCPCNGQLGWGGGCAHSGGTSATLLSNGSATVSNDSLAFLAAHLPAGTTAVLFQGTAGTTSAFGDGLLCVSGGLTRLGTTIATTTTCTWPLAGAPRLSVTGSVPPTGGDRYYQVFFREASGWCTSATFNLTSAQQVLWTP